MSQKSASWPFANVEATLADLHAVSSAKRTKFQARLKNFNRLGLLPNLLVENGKATSYQVGDIVVMALALEMTQLGLTPERVVSVMRLNSYPIGMACAMAAQALQDEPSIPPWQDDEERLLHMFLYFDPNVLRSLTDQGDYDVAAASLFFGGHGVVRDNIVRWSVQQPRIALVNVTMMLGCLLVRLPLKARDDFIRDVGEWARELAETSEAVEPEDVLGLREKLVRPLQHLATALRSGWSDRSEAAEVTLTTLLEAHGLLKWGQLLPGPFDSADPLRPDAMLDLPQDRCISLDAKVHFAVPGEEAKAILARVESLSQGTYWKRFDGSVEYAIIYVPSDGFLARALRDEPDLWDRAIERRLIIATPSSFDTVARVFSSLWHSQSATKDSDNGDDN